MPTAALDEDLDDTRLALLRSARDAFAAKGYAATHLDDILTPLGLTKGALYHHFGSKAGIFLAVYTWLEDDLHARVGDVIERAEGDAWTRTVTALDAYLEASARPSYARIVLTEARHVPGASTDPAMGHALVRTLVAALVEEGIFAPVSIEMATRVIRSAVDEVATTMANIEQPARARAEGRDVVLRMLEGLKA